MPNSTRPTAHDSSSTSRLHRTVVHQPALLRFTLATRVLLAVGFFAPGLTKLLGRRFVTTVTDDPVGRFFEALYQAGPYWRFLGAAQVAAAVCVLIPRLRALGAVLFAGITLNIAFITIALPFGNTAIIASLMFLASVWLLLWELPSWSGLLGLSLPPSDEPAVSRFERLGWLAATLGGWGATCVMRGLLEQGVRPFFLASLGLGALGGLVVLAAWVRAAVRPTVRAAA